MTGATDELIWLPARELAARIARGEISAREAVAASLERIEAVNRGSTPSASYCRRRRWPRPRPPTPRVPGQGAGLPARRADRDQGLHAHRGQAHHPRLGGARALGPEADPVVVRRLRAAGAILVGKTTTPEFAHASWTHSRSGATRNHGTRAAPRRLLRRCRRGGRHLGCVPLAEGTDAGRLGAHPPPPGAGWWGSSRRSAASRWTSSAPASTRSRTSGPSPAVSTTRRCSSRPRKARTTPTSNPCLRAAEVVDAAGNREGLADRPVD